MNKKINNQNKIFKIYFQERQFSMLTTILLDRSGSRYITLHVSWDLNRFTGPSHEIVSSYFLPGSFYLFLKYKNKKTIKIY